MNYVRNYVSLSICGTDKVKHNDISARIPLHKCAKKVEDVSRFVRLIETCLKMACHN
ncbi:hypothetical protein ECTW09109_2819 [Escherichia coli TW09109]|nr:hypothetical protein ECTW09109_2819 [Escherichia coli TW09109]